MIEEGSKQHLSNYSFLIRYNDFRELNNALRQAGRILNSSPTIRKTIDIYNKN
jgi:hypothetical protein